MRCAAEHFPHLFLAPPCRMENANVLPLSDFRFDWISPPMFSTIYRAMLRQADAAIHRVSDRSACFELAGTMRQLDRGDADAGVVHEEQELRLVLVFGRWRLPPCRTCRWMRP